ncbi:MAG: hypothetical protein DRN04_16705 [Thermoprotei archaeon]|nr:MAG: hypothetical protein DRN04_16705 [Thermoprotei archaeon]
MESKVYPPETKTVSESKEYMLPYSVEETREASSRGFSSKTDGRVIGGYMSNPGFSVGFLGVSAGTQLPVAGGVQKDFVWTSESSKGQEVKTVQPVDSKGQPLHEAQVSKTVTESLSKPLGPGRSVTVTPAYTITSSSSFSSTTRSSSTTVSSAETVSRSTTRSHAVTQSESVGEGIAHTKGFTKSWSHTVSKSQSLGETRTTSVQKGLVRGTREALAEATGETLASSQAQQYSVSEGGIWGMGIMPGVSLGYSTRRIDEAKRTVYELLSVEKQRLLEAISSGGFFVQAVILGKRDTVEAAKALILSSFTPTKPCPEPLYIVDGDEYLLLAAKTLSFDFRKGSRHPVRVYKVVNVYTTTELAGLTHPPRVEVKGIEVVAENIPEFSLPAKSSWDIEFGYALSHETLEPEARAGFDLKDLFHGIIVGVSSTGKTVLVTNIVNQLVELGAHVVVVDVKDEWRRLLRTVKGPKAFYALYDTEGKLPELHWNPLRPPEGVPWRAWLRTVLTWFVVAYSLGPRTYQVLRVHLTKLYREAVEEGRWPTLNDLYHSVKAARASLEKKKVSFTEIDVYDKILARLKSYCLDEEEGFEGELYRMFGRESDLDVVDLVYRNVYTDLEAKVMDSTDKPFLLSLIAFAVYLHAAYTSPYPWPVVLVMEEAPQSIPDVSGKFVTRELGLRQDVWADIAQLGRRYNVYVLAITQKPACLHKMILGNVRHVWIFQLNLVKGREENMEDVYIAAQLMGKDPERFHNEYARFVTRLPTGHCIYVNKRASEFFQVEPILVKCDLFEPPEVKNSEIASLVAKS